jgi:hypothetical protein
VEHLSSAGDAKQAARRGVLSTDEHSVLGDSGSVNRLAREDIEKIQVAHLGDDVDHVVLLGHVHGHWEIISGIRRDRDVLRSHSENTAGSALVATNFHHEELCRLVGLLVLEHQNLGLRRRISTSRDVNSGEDARVACT